MNEQQKQQNDQLIAELTSQPLQPLPTAQLAEFRNLDIIHAARAANFDVAAFIRTITSHIGQRGFAFECGGNSVRGGEFIIDNNGELQTHIDGKFYEKHQSEQGQGFLVQIERFAAYAREHKLPVGMAYGGPLSGTKPLDHPKISILMDELDRKYHGDFAQVFAGLPFTILNDSTAGLVSGAVEAAKRQPDPIVFYLINGGGIGLGVFKDGQIYTTEAGHIKVVNELNPHAVSRSCGLYGDHVCIENIASNKRGIEKTWFEQTGEHLTGLEIENRFRGGDPLAKELFLLTARLQACLIVGAANAFGIDVNDPRVEIVVHGSTNKTPGLKERMAQLIWQTIHPTKQIIDTNAYHENACELGIAEYTIAQNL